MRAINNAVTVSPELVEGSNRDEGRSCFYNYVLIRGASLFDKLRMTR